MCVMKKRGFTLIELLAVVVILAIIALIITPVISDLIESSRFASAVDSVLAYVAEANNQAAVSDEVTIGGFEGYSLDLSNNNRLETGVTDSELAKINYKGKGPSYVYLHFDDLGKYVNDGHFCMWGYSIDYKTDTDMDTFRDKYKKQLTEYAQLLCSAYPKYKITGFILWTQNWQLEKMISL